ncbi:MAG: hydrogenase accessory protein [Xanthobacteraceae bacterium]|nr:hydrogenase accessory protein [Xanthobacteraceae bacterium]
MASREASSTVRQRGLQTVDASSVEGFLAAADTAGAVAVLLLAGDPVRWPEASDVAVVLPELVDAFQGRIQGARVTPDAEVALASRFDVKVYPSLVLCRGGQILEVIPKIRDWSVYVDRISRQLDGSARAASPARVVKTISTLDRNGGTS